MTITAASMTRPSNEVFPPLACKTEGDGPDVVLIHGGVGSWTHWTRNIPGLINGFRIHALDLPGCGDSPDFPVGWTDEQYFAWVVDAILRRCHGPIQLVGFSFGGSVAAASAPLLGDRLASLSLVAAGSFGKPAPRDVQELPMRPRADVEIDERANARHNLGQIMFADPAAIDEAAVTLQVENVRRARFGSRRISWQDRIDADLSGVTCPIQFIWGLGDRMATPSVMARAERARAIKPDARIDLLDRGGHWIQYENAPAFNKVLRQFLTEFAPS